MFKKARKEQSVARVALIGPSGSGKTYTALRVGATLGKKLAVIDTERGSASKYAGDVADFDVCELETFAPEEYVKALSHAASAGYDVIVIDSLSHAWSGAGGALEMVDKAAARSRSGNSFAAWREVTPHHNALVDAILRYPGHVIATMRAKTEWVIEENDRGKKEPRKIGLAPIQRDGLEYEFDIVADIDPDHKMIVGKTRCPALDGAVISKPGPDVAATIRAWLDDGYDPTTDVIAALMAAHDAASLAHAKEDARRLFRTVTNGRRARLTEAVTAAERRLGSGETPRKETPAAAATEPRRIEAPKQLTHCDTAEELAAWCRQHGAGVIARGEDAITKVRSRAAQIGVGEDDALRMLGLEPEAA